MLDIPFPVETVPVDQAESKLQAIIDTETGISPVLLGDRDVLSTEWAEYVDVFENPVAILSEARALDANRWFANRRTRRTTRTVDLGTSYPAQAFLTGLVRLPGTVLKLPLRMVKGFARVSEPMKTAPEDHLISSLKAQLSELEAAGEGTEAELVEIREVIEEIKEIGEVDGLFPDPIDYVTPRRGREMAAGLVATSEPWENAAWLQHGAYAICAPKAVFVAHCRWLWIENGARLITASTNHIGFQMERPISTLIEAAEVMRRFELLGAIEINGDLVGSDGKSLVGAKRLWVWWD